MTHKIIRCTCGRAHSIPEAGRAHSCACGRTLTRIDMHQSAPQLRIMGQAREWVAIAEPRSENTSAQN